MNCITCPWCVEYEGYFKCAIFKKNIRECMKEECTIDQTDDIFSLKNVDINNEKIGMYD